MLERIGTTLKTLRVNVSRRSITQLALAPGCLVGSACINTYIASKRTTVSGLQFRPGFCLHGYRPVRVQFSYRAFACSSRHAVCCGLHVAPKPLVWSLSVNKNAFCHPLLFCINPGLAWCVRVHAAAMRFRAFEYGVRAALPACRCTRVVPCCSAWQVARFGAKRGPWFWVASACALGCFRFCCCKRPCRKQLAKQFAKQLAKTKWAVCCSKRPIRKTGCGDRI